jgi:hypothetical protein
MQRKYKTIHNKIKKLTNKTQVNQTKHACYKCIENLANVTFTEAETQLLDKGLKYNLHVKPKGWIKTLAIEADTTISKMNVRDQPYIRQLVAKNIQKLINKQKMKEESRQTHKEKIEAREHRPI